MSVRAVKSGFRVCLDLYNGPFDLLLYLVRKSEIDVLSLALSKLSAEFLEYVSILAAINVDEVGEFLVVASTLSELKSAALFPKDAPQTTSENDESSTHAELIRQLLEYKRFKEAAGLLASRAESRRQLVARMSDDLTPTGDPQGRSLRDIELWDLVSAFSRIMKENSTPTAANIARDTTPIDVYVQQIDGILREAPGSLVRLEALFQGRLNRAQMVGRFIALLEAIKRQRVWVEFDSDGSVLVMSTRPAPADAPVLHQSPESPPMQVMASPDNPPADAPLAPLAPVTEVVDRPETSAPAAPRTSAWADFVPLVEDSDRSDDRSDAA